MRHCRKHGHFVQLISVVFHLKTGVGVTGKFLREVTDRYSIITAIDIGVRFPEILASCNTKYRQEIASFKQLVETSESSAQVLDRIRSNRFGADQRMSMLKIFRRAVSTVIDTEMSKKVGVPTAKLVEVFGDTFKPIDLLRTQFRNLSQDEESALAALIGEYDTRGQLGYELTEKFFDWFEANHGEKYLITGPRRAGRDIELSSIYTSYVGDFPCDFVIKSRADEKILVIGFARYDSTRGGGQSDDRTGGNSDKVGKASIFSSGSGQKFRILFLADGPGLVHKDTWKAAQDLDDSYEHNVRVCTLKTAPDHLTERWMDGN